MHKPLPVSSLAALLAVVVLAWMSALPADAATPSGQSFAAQPSAQPSAQGSYCKAEGVNVVVDFHELGGGIHQTCDPAGAGKTAWKVFGDAGVDLTEVSSFAGAVCKVDAKPADTNCAKMPPADAYWSLLVGKGRKWTFASKGATQLKMHDGDFVALSWHGSKKDKQPGVAPVSGATSGGGSTQSQAGNGTSATADPADQAESDSGTSWWIPVAIVVVLLLGGGAVLAGRRRASD